MKHLIKNWSDWEEHADDFKVYPHKIVAAQYQFTPLPTVNPKNQDDWDQFFMTIAELASTMSYDETRRVGCVVTRNDNILSFSYNGTPGGTDNTMRDSNGDTLTQRVLHAETNALAKIMRSHETSKGSTIYTTLSPCENCAKAIYQSGAIRLVYRDLFQNHTGPLDFLQELGIDVKRI